MHELLARYYDDVWTKGDMPAADLVFTPDHVLHDPAHEWVSRGAEGMRRFVGVYRTAFPTISFAAEDQGAFGEKLVARIRWRAKHLGKLFHLPPTGRQVEVTGIEIHRIAEGRIVESWSTWDLLSLFEQLHVVPARLHEDTEEADLSYGKTHKRWWQAPEKGTDEPHEERTGE